MRIQIEEAAIPVREEVQGACEILGLDPLQVANEGRFVAFVPDGEAERALAVMGAGARLIGRVREAGPGMVTLKSRIGAVRILDMPAGEQMPRIC
jgi:hydrogenase expression/formation protein HypE